MEKTNSQAIILYKDNLNINLLNKMNRENLIKEIESRNYFIKQYTQLITAPNETIFIPRNYMINCIEDGCDQKQCNIDAEVLLDLEKKIYLMRELNKSSYQ